MNVDCIDPLNRAVAAQVAHLLAHTTVRARYHIFWGQVGFGKIGGFVHLRLLGQQAGLLGVSSR